jgi:hypothetical protein
MASGLEIKIRKGLYLDEVAFEAESNVELLYDCYLMSNNGNLIRAGIKIPESTISSYACSCANAFSVCAWPSYVFFFSSRWA